MYANLGPGQIAERDPPSPNGVDVMYSHEGVAEIMRERNLYRYVGNNPVISTDPSGLWELRCRRMGVALYLYKHCWVECDGHSYSLLNKDGIATSVPDYPADKGQGSVEASGDDECDCIRRQFWANRDTYDYDKDDCNSNYRASQLLQACGLQAGRPLGAYGWDDCTREEGKFKPDYPKCEPWDWPNGPHLPPIL